MSNSRESIDIELLSLQDVEKIDYSKLNDEQREAVHKKVNELFIETFRKYISDWCDNNNLLALSKK